MKKINKRSYNDNNDENGDDSDNIFNTLLSPTPPPRSLSSSLLFYPYFSDSPTISDINNDIESDNNGFKISSTRMSEAEKVAIVLEELKYQTPSSVKKIVFLENLNKLFLRADEIFNEKDR